MKGVGFPYEDANSPSHVVVYCPKLKKYVDVNGATKRPCKRFRVLNRKLSADYAAKYLCGYMDPNVKKAIPFAKTILRQLGQL